jgi:hypothetical protein
VVAQPAAFLPGREGEHPHQACKTLFQRKQGWRSTLKLGNWRRTHRKSRDKLFCRVFMTAELLDNDKNFQNQPKAIAKSMGGH